MRKYDVVYFLKPDFINNELRYSLRSIEANMTHGKVWFVGGQPNELFPDERMPLVQKGKTKWEKVRGMLRAVCENDDISKKFWLFNDDFFVLEKMTSEKALFNGTLRDHILHIEHRYNDRPTGYTKQLRACERLLKEAGLPTFNYAIHVPMLIDRKKMLEALDTFPTCPMFRSIYGNYAEVGGNNHKDVKIVGMNHVMEGDWDFVSTEDMSFDYGAVGAQLKRIFPEPCKYETE